MFAGPDRPDGHTRQLVRHASSYLSFERSQGTIFRVAETAEDATGYSADTARESLSQLVARILDQLSISAWLPSAAMTLLVAFVLELGSARSASSDLTHPQVGAVVGSAFAAIGRTSIGGLLLLVAATVVLTMVTQAFAFESIRLLEGYWGVSRPAERLAQARARHWRKVRRRLASHRKRVIKQAWKHASRRLGREPGYTETMVRALRAQILGTGEAVALSEAQFEKVDSTEWELFAPADSIRRLVNLDAKLADFPSKASSMMPTRLGNVLRRWEDLTGNARVETMIDSSFDTLPASLAASHDEQRSRLDLYCSMQFVLLAVAVVATLRFAWLDWRYALGIALVCGIASLVLYRAAVASARYYGSLLVTVSEHLRRVSGVEVTPEG